MKSKKRGMKSGQGTGLGAGLGRNLQKTLINFYFGCDKSFPLGYQIQIGNFEVSLLLDCDKSIPLDDFALP
jgi:hypothetical protein